MKNSLKIVLSVLLVALSAASLGVYFWRLATVPQQPEEFKFQIDLSSRGGGNITGVLNCNFPAVPTEVPVLEVVRYNYTDDEAKTMARFFNITGELNVTRWVWDSGVVETRVFGSGGVSNSLRLFDNGALAVYLTGSSDYYPVLTNFTVAKEIADELMEKIKSIGVVPKLTQIRFREVGYSEYYGTGGGTYPTAISVYYDVEYDGRPFVFKGETVVSIGNDGNLKEFRAFWHNIKLGRNVSLIPVEETLTTMSSHITSRSADKIQTLVVNRIFLGYYAPPPGSACDELLPEYEMDCLAINNDGTEQPEFIYVPATNASLP